MTGIARHLTLVLMLVAFVLTEGCSRNVADPIAGHLSKRKTALANFKAVADEREAGLMGENLATAQLEAAEDLLAYWKIEVELLRALKTSFIAAGDAAKVEEAKQQIALAEEAVKDLREDIVSLTPISGRYVRVEMPGDAAYMALAEVQVFRNGTNIALAGTATQSSTYDKHQHGPDYAGKAIDNNTSGDILADGSVSHTRKDRSPWWEVDLGATYPIETITVWGRSEHYHQSSNLKVSVLDAQRKNVWSSNAFNAVPNAMFNLKAKN